MDAEFDEVALASRASKGDAEALAELSERTRLWLFRQAYAALGHYDDAQDVVADTLLQVCCHAGELRDPSRMRAWMRVVLRNEIRRHARRRSLGCDGRAAEPKTDPHPEWLLHLDIE